MTSGTFRDLLGEPGRVVISAVYDALSPRIADASAFARSVRRLPGRGEPPGCPEALERRDADGDTAPHGRSSLRRGDYRSRW